MLQSECDFEAGNAHVRCAAVKSKAGANVPGNSIWALGEMTDYGVAVCGEKVC
jgi:hypothetical protein